MEPSDENLNGERREENNGLNRSTGTSSTDHSGITASYVFQNTPPARISRRRSLNDISAVDSGLRLNNLLRESERPRRSAKSESDADEWNVDIEEFRESLDHYRILRHVLPNFPETPPSAQNEATISHADPDRDSNSDLSSILGVGPGSATGSALTRNPTLASHKFYFPDMRLDSEGNESPSDGSSSEEE